MYRKEYFHSMILHAPCYQDPVACLIYLLGIAEPEHEVGRILV